MEGEILFKQFIFLEIFFGIFFCLIFFSTKVNAQFATEKTILYIPIDNRPCNLNQVVETAEKIGYKILTPPENILGHGSLDNQLGNPDELWTWLSDNASGVQAAVISSDAMLYGSLVGSRKHNLSEEEILNRVKKFSDFKKNFPYLPIYIFATVMRTPIEGNPATTLEPEYYKKYGRAIFEFTALKDKQEIAKISRKEQKQIDWLNYYIPNEVKEDWFARRDGNFNANKFLVDLMKNGTFEYLLIGCDDNSVFSQTHLESRRLAEYAGKFLAKSQFQVMSGADELGMLMISRAVNKNLNEIPFVATFFNVGKGGETIPSYSNEKISVDVEKAIFAAGGLPVPSPERADFILAVNTRRSGKTFEAMSEKNIPKQNKDTENFMKLLLGLVEKNYPVGVIDISFANGADNSLMQELKNKNLQFKIQSYGGWNTPTNASGFLIGEGVLTKFLTERDKNSLLLTRYLDDWIYQANVRPFLIKNLNSFSGEGSEWNLNEKYSETKIQADKKISDFAEKNIRLPKNFTLKNISAEFTWNRLFESNISFDFSD